jgi:hypothetical protein
MLESVSDKVLQRLHVSKVPLSYWMSLLQPVNVLCRQAVQAMHEVFDLNISLHHPDCVFAHYMPGPLSVTREHLSKSQILTSTSLVKGIT